MGDAFSFLKSDARAGVQALSIATPGGAGVQPIPDLLGISIHISLIRSGKFSAKTDKSAFSVCVR